MTRLVGDIATAEELAQDALVAALEQWPGSGVPERPGPWLMATARHHATDLIRRRVSLERKYEELGRDAERDRGSDDLDSAIDDDLGDDLLGLMFMACHPILSKDARVALTLRVLGGLTTEEIARGFLVSVPSIAQRIVRAKRTLAEAGVRFEIPASSDRAARLGSVLEVIYLIFNEGYSATAGKDWVRPALCEEAMRLGRILAELAPDESEVHGLVALMELHASRLEARVDRSGEPVLLLDQDRSRWDRLLVGRGLAAQWVRMGCRRRSRHATLEPRPRRRLTGRASWRSTTRSRSSRPRPSSSSTGGSPLVWRLVRPQGSKLSTRSSMSPRSGRITSCPRYAATF
jgi:RNA polymerase sigma factor (sigma-70 family)